MKRVKIIASIFAVLLLVALTYAWYIKGGITPRSAEEYEYDRPFAVLEELADAGFRNITRVPIDDEDMDEYPWLQLVSEVSIAGDTDFRAGKRYRTDEPVQISYYQVPRKEIPLNSDDLQNYDHETIVNLFEGAGFNNLYIREYVDLDPSEGLAFKNEVLLEEDPTFTQGQEYPRSLPILIAVHYPIPEHKVTIDVSFTEYAADFDGFVRLFLDDVETRLLEVGQDESYEFTMLAGEHTLTFYGADEEAPSRKITVTVDADMNIHCNVKAADTVVLEDISVDYQEKE